MSTIEERPNDMHEVEDPPELSAEALAAGTNIEGIFRALPVEVRRELIKPLADTLTTTEVASANLSADAATELADSLEENAKRLREHASRQRVIENRPPIETRYPADDY